MANSKLVNKNTVKALLNTGRVFTIAVFVITIGSLFFRIIDFSILQKISPGLIVINPLTAICLFALGLSIWLIRKPKPHRVLKKISTIHLSYAFCILVLAISATRIVAFILNIPFAIDQLLFPDQLKIPQSSGLDVEYNSLGINTAICMILLSLSVIFIDSKKSWFYSNPQTLNYIVLFISFLTIYGYIYSVEDLYTSLGKIPMSFLSAVCLILLSSSALFFRPYQGTMASLIGQNPTEVFAIRFLAFFIPMIIGYLKIWGEDHNLFNERVGTALMATTTYVISMTLLGWKSTIQFKLQQAKVRRFNIVKKDWERMSRVLNNSQTLVMIADIKRNKLIFSNDTGKVRPKEELEGQNLKKLIDHSTHPDDLEKTYERLERIKKLGDDEYDDMTYRFIGTNGDLKWLFSRAIVFKRVNGEVTQVLFNSIDITQKKEKEEELKEKKKKLKNKKEELEEAREKLEKANKKLNKEVKKRAEDLVKSEKKYRDYIKNSYQGIIRYETKGDDIMIDQPEDDFIKKMTEKFFIKEANSVAAINLGYDDPKEMEGIPFKELANEIPEKVLEEKIKEFLDSGFRLYGLEPVVRGKKGKKIKTFINLLGIVKNKKIDQVWEIQSKSRVKKID